MPGKLKYYPRKEEYFNVITHLLGFLLSILALSLLVVYACLDGTAWHIVSFSIFGGSLVLQYLASTLYHSAKKKDIRRKLNIFDHTAIYVLIAGTFTPFLLVTLNGPWGWSMFGVIWGLALSGIIFKFYYTGKYKIISTLGYIFMGLTVLIVVNPLMEKLPAEGLNLIFLGGAFYIIGAIIYMIKKIPYNHGIFHVFVLLGSVSHFFSVFLYVL